MIVPVCDALSVTEVEVEPMVTFTVPSGRATGPDVTVTVTLTGAPALTEGAVTLTVGVTLPTFLPVAVDVASLPSAPRAVTRAVIVAPMSAFVTV